MSPSQVDEALEAMRGLFPETPLQLNEHLSARYGANVYLKREDLTPVRSYKIRGAFNFFRKIVADSPSGTTFVCASAGNHAQGFAYVCRHFGVQGVVFMPVTTPQQKIDKTRIFGGDFITIRLVGDIFDQCYAAAREHVEAIGGYMVPPFDHPDIIEGQATVAAEILQQLPGGVTPDLDVVAAEDPRLVDLLLRRCDRHEDRPHHAEMAAGEGHALRMVTRTGADEMALPGIDGAHLAHRVPGAAQLVAAHRRQILALQPDVGLIALRQEIIPLQGRFGKQLAQGAGGGSGGLGKLCHILPMTPLPTFGKCA